MTALDDPALSVFDVRVDRSTAVVTAMLALDAVWWFLVLGGHLPMPGMSYLMAAGVPMQAPGAMATAVAHAGTLRAYAEYVLMWGVMMWAMMYPAMTRFTRDYATALRGSPVAVAATVAAFLAGYNLVWALSAVVPLATNAVLPGGIYGVTRASPALALGSVLALTGLYQCTRVKHDRLRSCCARVSPREADALAGLVEGLRHGVSCVVVCLGVFFLVMPFFGAMNAFWMAALTLPIAAERLPASWGRELAVGVGVVAFVAGVFVLFAQPALPVGF